MKRTGEGSRAAGGSINHGERGRARERERRNHSAAVALAAVIGCAWPAPAGAQSAPLTMTVTPAKERLERVSQEVREAVRIIDSDDGSARANALWRMYRAVARGGDLALLKWAFELQSVVRSRKGNYLHALCWVLNEYDSGRARTFATELARLGVAIGPNAGHYEVLAHLDPSEQIPNLPARVGMYLGPGGRLYPLRMDRLSTPNLWAARHAALAEMRRYNQAFEELGDDLDQRRDDAAGARGPGAAARRRRGKGRARQSRRRLAVHRRQGCTQAQGD